MFNRRTVFLALAALLLSASVSVNAATLADFGYRRMTQAGNSPIGTRPLLIVMATCSGCNPNYPFTNDWIYYHNFVFNSGPNPPGTVNGYFNEVSNGQFSWSPVNTSLGAGAGVIQITFPLTMSYNEILTRTGGDAGAAAGIYYSNMVSMVMNSGSVNFAAYDSNTNGVVTPDELTIAVLTTEHTNGGGVTHSAAPSAGRVPGPVVDYEGYVDIMDAKPDILLFCHELSHLLGDENLNLHPPDLYVWNVINLDGYLSLMGSLGFEHLDPWDKMQLGWSEPRIHEMIGETFTLPAAQLMNSNAPVILFDPSRGTSNYFMLEYRTQSTTTTGVGYERDVGNEDGVRAGLAIWTIWQDTYHAAVGIAGTNYVLCLDSPDLSFGLGDVWPSNTTTPYLRYLDGTSTGTRIHVRPFSSGASSITVELLSDGHTWVDFNYGGSRQGTFDNPYKLLSEGLANVPAGGTIHFKIGSSAQSASSAKAMTLSAYNGPVTFNGHVTIGR